MQIVIIGNGSVGDSLISSICGEGHNVTVIDEDATLVDEVVNKYDVFGIVGNGASVDIQKQAGVQNCDVLISVATEDELNMLCCMIGKRLGAAHAIARVRNPQYLRQTDFMCEELGIDLIVNPEYEAAREAARIIRFPVAMKLDKFAKGQVEIVEIHIHDGHPLVGQKLLDLRSKYSTNVLICAVSHGDDVVIPGGDYVIRAGDIVSITASRKDISDFFVKLGIIVKKFRSIFIIGGNNISRYLADMLSSGGFSIKIVEQNLAVCHELAELFPKAEIICGNAADPDLLTEEGIDDADACVAMTTDDKNNIIISMFAKTRGVDKVIARVSAASFGKLSGSAGIDSDINPKYITAANVIRYVRGLANLKENSSQSTIKTLYKLADNKIEALEFDVGKDFLGLSIPLRSIKLKSNLLIAAIIRDGAVIYPHGQTTLEVGDSVIVITNNKHMNTLDDILA
ncbi:MAG: Trk system potassium transporter TrkA [Ruminococcaceae bacterium]|nr:Trk system potassium transporter TrkA [Oscillospiraceae bacterium]